MPIKLTAKESGILAEHREYNKVIDQLRADNDRLRKMLILTMYGNIGLQCYWLAESRLGWSTRPMTIH